MSDRVKRKGSQIILTLSPRQVSAIYSLVNQANSDGDHYDWLKSAGASASELSATRDVMVIAQDAHQLARSMDKP